MESWLKRVRPAVEEKEKEIPIYLRVTKTIKLNIKESDDIGLSKRCYMIRRAYRYVFNALSGDDKLADGWKLVDYGICQNSFMLMLKIQSQ
ncbi:hypothetical protein P3L10_014460 [Capsicum annuum]